MTYIRGFVAEACNPYPSAPSSAAYDANPDTRHARWLFETLDRLSPADLKDLARTLAILHPVDFEQDLLTFQRSRRRS